MDNLLDPEMGMTAKREIQGVQMMKYMVKYSAIEMVVKFEPYIDKFDFAQFFYKTHCDLEICTSKGTK